MVQSTTGESGAQAPLPRTFRLIRLELAREAGHPGGSREHGYTIVAPLDDNGHIDATLWKEHRDLCRVVRFRPDEENDIGHLVRKGESWGFHYDIQGDEEDETGYRFGDERFVIGEYVSIHEDGKLRTFTVTSVERV